MCDEKVFRADAQILKSCILYFCAILNIDGNYYQLYFHHLIFSVIRNYNHRMLELFDISKGF